MNMTKVMTNIHAKQGLQTTESQSSKSSSSSASSSSASTITPRRSPGPWFLVGAPSKLSIRPALTSTRPPRCNDFQLFERLKLSAGLGPYPPYCPHRFFVQWCAHIAYRTSCGGRAILAHREMLCCRAFSWRTASADPLSDQK